MSEPGLKFFKLNEFNCHCCGKQHMDPVFLAMLDNARGYGGVPFPITSGYRCEKHNAAVGSTSINHTSGKAVDVRCENGPSRIRIVKGLIQAGFDRIGIGPKFIHADCTNQTASIWLYP